MWVWWTRGGIRRTARHPEGARFLLRRKNRVPVIDRAYGDPRLAAMRTAALHGGAAGWPEVRGHLAAAEGQEDLTFLVGGLHDVVGMERWIGEVVAARPDDTLALLVSAARQVTWAWQARGSGRADSVTEDGWTLFRERLVVAEEQLLDVAEREPSWATPWYFLQIAGRGLQVGPDVALRRFEATCRRAPGHAAAHRQYLQQLSKKWGGSHERMHAFARESMLGAPEGSRLGELVAEAYLEEWLDAGGDPDSARLRDPRVVRALHEAGARSVHHPAFERSRDWAIAVNSFALAFGLAGEDAAARTMFRMVAKQPTESPWNYLNGRSPVVPFLAWRNRVGA